MVQFLNIKEKKKPKFSEMLGRGLSSGLTTGLNLIADYENREKENAFAKELGLDLEGVRDPETRNKLLIEAQKANFKNQQIQQKQAMLSSLLGPQGQQGYQADQFGAPQQPKRFSDQLQGSGEQPQPSQFGQPFEQGQGQPDGFEFQDMPYEQDQLQQPPRYFRYSPKQILQASMMDPNLSRTMQAQEEADAKRFYENRKLEEESPRRKRQQEIAKLQAKTDLDYYNSLQSEKEKAIIKERDLNKIEELVKKKAGGKIYERLLESAGFTELTSEGRRELASSLKNLYTDFKTIVGSQMSAQEFFTLTQAYPNPNYSEEANLAIIDNIKDALAFRNKRQEIAVKLKKQNKGEIPEFLQEKVNAELEKYATELNEKIKARSRLIRSELYKLEDINTLKDLEGNTYRSVPKDVAIDMLDSEEFVKI